MKSIITIENELEKLHTKSVDIKIQKNGTLAKADEQLVQDILETLPGEGVGLASPQIGICKRIFVAQINNKKYIFINPRLIKKSPDQFPSLEGCLSIPNVNRCVNRYFQVTIDADIIREYDLNNTFVLVVNEPITVRGFDSAVIQHENDHLDGVLITDLAEVPTYEQKQIERQTKRKQKKLKNKFSNKTSVPNRHTKKMTMQEKRRRKSTQKRRQKQMEIAERYRLEKEGILAQNNIPDEK